MNSKLFNNWLQDFVNDLEDMNLIQFEEIKNHLEVIKKEVVLYE